MVTVASRFCNEIPKIFAQLYRTTTPPQKTQKIIQLVELLGSVSVSSCESVTFSEKWRLHPVLLRSIEMQISNWLWHYTFAVCDTLLITEIRWINISHFSAHAIHRAILNEKSNNPICCIRLPRLMPKRMIITRRVQVEFVPLSLYCLSA